MRSPLVGVLLCLVAAVIWGLAFVPQKLTVVSLPPLLATAARFLVAAPVAGLAALLLAGRPALAPDTGAGRGWRAPVLLGVVLYLAYALQTAALVHAPVARVSLITGLYAIFVPFFAPLFGLPRPLRLHWLGAAIAVLGLALLVGVVGGDALAAPVNVGDLYVLLHAVLGAVQILLVSRVARRVDPFTLNARQLLVLTVIAVPIALVVDGTDALATVDLRTMAAFAYLAVFSTVVAFTSQIFGQRHASAPAAAVVMLLETPVGVLGALVIFEERMAPLQWVGAVVLLCGVVVSLAGELRRQPRAPIDSPA